MKDKDWLPALSHIPLTLPNVTHGIIYGET